SSPDGLAVEVMIGLDGKTATALHTAGRPIPPPIPARALVDTATDLTALDSRLVNHFGLVVASSGSTHTAAGSVSVIMYEISLTISNPKLASSPMLVRPTLVVTELSTALPNCEVLLGMDVLWDCLLISDGPGRQFTLGF